MGFQADERDYDLAAEILKDLGIKEVDLLTNNPDKIGQLEDYGITIHKRVPLEIPANPVNLKYLATKKERFSHMLKLDQEAL